MNIISYYVPYCLCDRYKINRYSRYSCILICSNHNFSGIVLTMSTARIGFETQYYYIIPKPYKNNIMYLLLKYHVF